MPSYRSRLLHWGVGVAHEPVGRPDDQPAGQHDEPRHTDTIVATDPAQLAPLRAAGFAAAASLIFVPEGGGDVDAGGQVVAYRGDIAAAGAEFAVGDEFFVQVQSYGISAYMSVLGPTLVRIGDQGDWEAFLQDADQARCDGDFPQFLTHPVVHLADVPALGGAVAGGGPQRRLFVTPDGVLSTSAAGRPLGTLADSTPQQITQAWQRANDASQAPCAIALGGVLAEPERVPALRERPWLARYLAAVEALRRLTARGAYGLRVGGFGGWIGAEDAGDGSDDPRTPMLLRTDEEAFLHDPRTGRTFSMGMPAARVVETLLRRGSVSAASEFADPALLQQAELLLARFGLHAGSTVVAATGAPVAA